MAHRHNDNLTGEHKATDIGQLIIFCLFMALWISDMILKYSVFLNAYIPLVIRLSIGILLLLIAGYMARTGMSIVFGKNAQSKGVIRTGVFRFVRHPINIIPGFIGTEYFFGCDFNMDNSNIFSTLCLSLRRKVIT